MGGDVEFGAEGGTVDLRAGNFKRLETEARFPLLSTAIAIASIIDSQSLSLLLLLLGPQMKGICVTFGDGDGPLKPRWQLIELHR